ncbi:MAG: site-specific integrase, partial [Pirellulales bacterium]|nr:site-specific integrase [Pirellulales bacterium]
MASIFKNTLTQQLPPSPDLIMRKGKQFLRKKHNGRTILLPLTTCGTKYRYKSSKWYIQYRDENGEKKRVPGFTDKEATQQLAAELERKAQHIQSGLADPHEQGKLRSLKKQLEDFRTHLLGKSNSKKHVRQTCNRIESIIAGCTFSRWVDIVGSTVEQWLATERAEGRMGIKTSNYYLAAFKQFCTWLETDGRVPKKNNPVEHLSAINAETDVRWERRAISPEEFVRLIKAAATGPDVQCMCGPDRAMLYIVAAWTGYRRKELASITLKSFNLDSEPATVQVKASHSKRRKNDIVPLHPMVAQQLKDWLALKGNVKRDEPLFNLRSKSGALRRTSKMMRLDLERARLAWVEEAQTDKERKQREESDFLQYRDENGMYADFHANRHTFITNLAKAGVHPKLAQSMAGHSDVNLTMGIYSHVEVAEQAEAVSSLPAPPTLPVVNEAADSQVTSTDSTAENHAPIHAPAGDFWSLCQAVADYNCPSEGEKGSVQNPLPQKELVILCQSLTSDDQSSGGGT